MSPTLKSTDIQFWTDQLKTGNTFGDFLERRATLGGTYRVIKHYAIDCDTYQVVSIKIFGRIASIIHSIAKVILFPLFIAGVLRKVVNRVNIRKQREIILEPIRQNGLALEHAHEHLKKDREVVLEAVRQNGLALEHAHEYLKKDREIVLEAVKQNGLALKHVHKDLKEDREIVSEAIKQAGLALVYAHKDLKNTH